MTVTRFQDLPLTGRDHEWDGAAAERRVRELTGATDEPTPDHRDAHSGTTGTPLRTTRRTACWSPTPSTGASSWCPARSRLRVPAPGRARRVTSRRTRWPRAGHLERYYRKWVTSRRATRRSVLSLVAGLHEADRDAVRAAPAPSPAPSLADLPGGRPAAPRAGRHPLDLIARVGGRRPLDQAVVTAVDGAPQPGRADRQPARE